MILAVASGKGGTGKTTLATALAVCTGGPVRVLDCDVEEPNAHLFLEADSSRSEPVAVKVPRVDTGRCTGCGVCAAFCRYNAIAGLKSGALVFPELCHSCGGCAMVCPTGAISETERTVGELVFSQCGEVELVTGRLDVGNTMAGPVIRAVKRHAAPEGLTIIDCPPGTSCSMVAAVTGADFVLLVTEPTPFGRQDLELAVETVRRLGLDFAVAINRCDAGDDCVEDYCSRENIPVVVRIPHSMAVARAYSRGGGGVLAEPELVGPVDGWLKSWLPRAAQKAGR